MSRADNDYPCLVCGEPDYELRLCHEHLDAYLEANPGAERIPRPDVAKWAEKYAREERATAKYAGTDIS